MPYAHMVLKHIYLSVMYKVMVRYHMKKRNNQKQMYRSLYQIVMTNIINEHFYLISDNQNLETR